MRATSKIGLLLVALFVGSVSQLGAEAECTDGLITDEDGYRKSHRGLSIEARLSSDLIDSGDPIPLTCTLKNSSKIPLRLEKPEPHALVTAAYVINIDGCALQNLNRVHVGNWVQGVSLEGFTFVLQPGESHSYQVDLEFAFGAPEDPDGPFTFGPFLSEFGEYMAQCRYGPLDDYESEDVWEGNIVSDPVVFSVVEPYEENLNTAPERDN